MRMIVSIHQPNYLPWLGFFNKLLRSDIMVIFDNVQFPRGKTVISRTAIKTPTGSQWLTVPVKGKSELLPIREVQLVENQAWVRKHLKSLEANYGRAPYFDRYYPQLAGYYQGEHTCLAELNSGLISLLAGFLGATTKLVRASELQPEANAGGLDRILGICRTLGATEYLTGQGAGSQRYMDEEAFKKLGIKVVLQDFVHPVYSQLWGGFIPKLSVLDLLFNHGPAASGILLERSSG